MLCSSTKRLISRREDTGRPLSARAERHLLSCTSCREFERFCLSLKTESVNALNKTSEEKTALNSRVLSALKQDSVRRPGRTRGWKLIPAPALAGLAAVAVIGLVWLGYPRGSSLSDIDRLIDLETVEALKNEVVSVESPLQQEKEEFEKTLDSAVRFLISRLDPGLGD
jgi:hypothetical protein